MAQEPGRLEHIGVTRAAFAATIGNMLEFYDFITYSFFAIQIGHTFFPTQGEFGSLLREVFEPRTLAELHWDHWTNLRGRPAHVYSFRVRVNNSRYMMVVGDRGKRTTITAGAANSNARLRRSLNLLWRGGSSTWAGSASGRSRSTAMSCRPTAGRGRHRSPVAMWPWPRP